jgi:hypothetical protein
MQLKAEVRKLTVLFLMVFIGQGAVLCAVEETVLGQPADAQRTNFTTQPTVAAAPADGREANVSSEGRLYATPIGENVINPFRYSTITPSLILNSDGDRVGVRVELCQGFSDNPCDGMTFVFPQLRLDRSKKLVVYGDTPVATFRSWGQRMEPMNGYRLNYEVDPERYDNGFNRRRRSFLKIFLEHR